LNDEEYKPFIDKVVSFIANKFFYPYIIILWIGIIILFFNKTIGGFIIGILTIVTSVVYIIYDIHISHKRYKLEKEIKKEIDISKYFDNVKYDLYNEEDVEEFKKQ